MSEYNFVLWDKLYALNFKAYTNIINVTHLVSNAVLMLVMIFLFLSSNLKGFLGGLCFWFLFFFLEMRSHYIVLAGLEPTEILMPLVY